MTEQITTFVSPSLCPECGCKLDAATSTTEAAKPEPGDFSICLECGTILRFDAQLHSRRATDADFREAPITIMVLLKGLGQIRDIVVPPGSFRRDERRH